MRKLLNFVATSTFFVLFCGSAAGQTWSMNEIAIRISKVSYSGEIAINITNTARNPSEFGMMGTVGERDVGVFLWLEKDASERSFKTPRKTLLRICLRFVSSPREAKSRKN